MKDYPAFMIQYLQKHFKQIAGITLLAFFVSFWVGTNFYVHTHIVNNVLVVHSHPFSSETSHQHSSDQLSHIQHFQHIDVYAAGYMSPQEVLYNLTDTLAVNNLHFLRPDTYRNISALRAPPTC